MARFFAEIGADQQVQRVIVCDDPDWPGKTLGGSWTETKMEAVVENYAGIGMHDSEEVAPQRFIHPWVQPTGSEDAYPKGAWVWDNGRAWHNLTDFNVQKPGVSGWREVLTEWPEYVQPTGAHDAYIKGEKITWQGQHYVSKIDANVWSPHDYPDGWMIAPLDQPTKDDTTKR